MVTSVNAQFNRYSLEENYTINKLDTWIGAAALRLAPRTKRRLHALALHA